MNSKLKIFIFGFVVTMFSVVGLSYSHVYALTSQDVTSGNYNFKDGGTIIGTIAGQECTFTDSKPYDSNHSFVATSSSGITGFCNGRITVNDATIFVQSSRTGSTQASIELSGISGTILVGNIQNASAGARLSGLTFVSQVEIKSDSGLIFKRTDPKSLTLLRSGEVGGGFQVSGSNTPVACNDILLLNGASGPGLMVELDIGDNGVEISKLLASSNIVATSFAKRLITANPDYKNCSVQRINGQGGDGFDSNAVDEVGLASLGRMSIADPTDASGKKASELTADQAANATADTEDPDACENKGLTMGWIICPVIEMGIAATDKVFSDFIKPLMEDVPVSAGADSPSFKAWNQFRWIGNIVLIGTMLAVVYSQVRD